MAAEDQEVLFVDKAEFIECEDASRSHDPTQRLVLLTLNRIDRENLTQEQVEASRRGDSQVEVPTCYDLMALDDHDSHKLMLALAGIRARQGCALSRRIVRMAESFPGS